MRRFIVAWIIIMFGGLIGFPLDIHAEDASGTIQKAFKQGNANLLSRFLPEKGRITVSISAVGINSGEYSKSQAIALLRNAFSKYKTLSFSMNSGRGALRGEWVVRPRKGEKKKTITVYFSVKTKNGRTTIRSIRGG